MSGIKARWSNATVEIDESIDPFAEDAEVHVPSVGVPIKIGMEEASLDDRLRETLRVEGALDAEGVTCAIKDLPNTSCFACPLYEGGDMATKQGALCRVGREQESIVTLLAVQRHGGRR